MNWIKVTAILLITAIFNPLCCCLVLAAQVLEKPAAPLSDHSCCLPEKDIDADMNHHSHQECPHSSQKDSQINEASTAQDGKLKPQQTFAYTLPPLPIFSADLSYQKTHPNYEGRSTREPHSPLNQAYCVYLL